MINHAKGTLLVILVLASLIMGGVLFQMRERAHQRMLSGQDAEPTQAPAIAAPVQATLLVANDDDNSLRGQIYSLPLPSDPGARARAVLAKLLDLYAATDSNHPVPGGGASIAEVFLLPAEGTEPKAAADNDSSPRIAVVNLKSSFVASHPSGLETETLTVLSICGTLHANLPRVTEVRFLVDGATRPTLAGHADLTRTYLTSDAVPADLVHP